MGYTQAAVIFPVIVVAPRYFAKRIGLGGLMQVVNAFSFVQNSLWFIINSYAEVAAWQAVTQRLSCFEQQLLAIHQSKRALRQINIRRGGVGVAVKEIDLDLPGVRMIVAMFLTKDLHMHWRKGEQYFMQKLIDGDIASNNGGWQRSAGTGGPMRRPIFEFKIPTNSHWH